MSVIESELTIKLQPIADISVIRIELLVAGYPSSYLALAIP
jgi:hypothetical protein